MPRLFWGVFQDLFPHDYKARSSFLAFGRRVKQKTMSRRSREVRVVCLGVGIRFGWDCAHSVTSP